MLSCSPAAAAVQLDRRLNSCSLAHQEGNQAEKVYSLGNVSPLLGKQNTLFDRESGSIAKAVKAQQARHEL